MDEKRGKALRQSTLRRDELLRNIEILEQALKRAGPSIERLGRTLAQNPSNVRPSSLREHTFELPGGVTIMLNWDEVRCTVTKLKEARDELFSVQMVLEPGIPADDGVKPPTGGRPSGVC